MKPRLENLAPDIYLTHNKTSGNATFSYHQHNACEIYFILSGNIRIYVEQSCFLPAPDSLIILNPNEMHRVQSISDDVYERISIYIKKSYMEHLSHTGIDLSKCFYSRPIGQQNICQLTKEQKQEFLSIFNHLEKNMNSNQYGDIIRTEAYASILLAFLNELYEKSHGNHVNTMPVYIMHAMQYIEAHLQEPLRLQTLADELHISPTHLSAQFKYHTGLSFRDYLLDRKIAHTKLLLQQGSSVTVACFESGFNDYANFLRSFKKREGISPGAYKKQFLSL